MGERFCKLPMGPEEPHYRAEQWQGYFSCTRRLSGYRNHGVNLMDGTEANQTHMDEKGCAI